MADRAYLLGLPQRAWGRLDIGVAALALFLASGPIVFTPYLAFTVLHLPVGDWWIGGTYLRLAGYSIALALVTYLVMRNRGPLRTWLVVLVIVAVVAYSAWATWSLGGPVDATSDRDDALALAGRALLSGGDPWGQTTQLDNVITVGPGGILLALPLVALTGSVAAQNTLWLAALLVVVAVAIGSRAVVALSIMLVGSLVTLNELVWRYDLLSVSIVLALATIAALVVARRGWTTWLVVTAVAAGIAAGSRFTLAPVLVPAAVLLWRLEGRRVAVIWGCVAGGVFAVLHVAAWALFPGYGTSLSAATALVPLDAKQLVGIGTAALVLGIAVVGSLLARTVSGHLWVMALIALALPALNLALLLLTTHKLAVGNYAVSGYLMPFLLFAALALVTPTRGEPAS